MALGVCRSCASRTRRGSSEPALYRWRRIVIGAIPIGGLLVGANSLELGFQAPKLLVAQTIEIDHAVAGSAGGLEQLVYRCSALVSRFCVF